MKNIICRPANAQPGEVGKRAIRRQPAPHIGKRVGHGEPCALSPGDGKAPGVARLLFDLRTQLAAHGARGIVGLGRKFRICDDDGDGRLSVAEFNKALNELGLAELTAQERRAVFSHFDCDSSGFLNYEEFLMNVRGPLSQARLGIIDEAFAVLDVNKDGAIAPDEIASKFDASRHPDVLRGKATEQDVYRDFLDTFDVGGVVDGKVTKEEFANYYANVSSSIDDDDYFELCLRNAWHISGGEGWCANTANLRKTSLWLPW